MLRVFWMVIPLLFLFFVFHFGASLSYGVWSIFPAPCGGHASNQGHRMTVGGKFLRGLPPPPLFLAW
jgi:hypothetical protein